MQAAACNTPRTSFLPTLPSINDPSLDALQSCRAPEPSHEEIMAALESETQCVRQLRSPRAKALAAVGLDSKSWRSEDCGSKRIHRCPDHHDQFEEQHRTCRLKTCLECASRLAEERIARFWENQPYMRSLKHFHWIAIHEPIQDTMPSREQIQEYNTRVSKFIKHLGDPRPGTGAVSNVAIEALGVDASDAPLSHFRFRLGATIFWWGDISDRDLHDYAIGCLQHSVAPAADLSKAIRELLTIHPPRSHEVCAQIELVTQGLRLIRSHGQMLKKDLLLDEDTLELPADAEALVAEECDTATNDQLKPVAPHKCCKKCGNALSEVSDWISRYAPAAELKQLKWTIMNNAPPPE